jgi:hypothetical protein
VTCSDDIQCGPCPELHHGGDYYGSRHNDDGSFIAEVTPTLSKCIVTPDYLVVPVPLTLKPTWSYAGTYTAMCFLEDDSKAGCKFPDTCEDTVVAIQGLIYEVPAIRLGAASPVVENSAVEGECGPPVRRRAAGKAAEKPAGAAAPKGEPHQWSRHSHAMVGPVAINTRVCCSPLPVRLSRHAHIILLGARLFFKAFLLSCHCP